MKLLPIINLVLIYLSARNDYDYVLYYYGFIALNCIATLYVVVKAIIELYKYVCKKRGILN